MIPVPSQVRIWLAVGRTDMRRGMQGLALQVQETLGRDPHAGDLYVFRGRSGNLIKIIWHDGLGMSLSAREGPVSVAVAGGRHGFHFAFTVGVHARRDRLAQPAPHVPTAARGLSFSLSLRHFPRVSGRVL